MSAPRFYTGTFCTGHVPMVGSTAIQFEENAKKEFVEEYKKCHNMKRKKGPGLGYVYDFTAQPQRPSPAVPVAGCALSLLTTGMFPERQAPTSSKAIGSWWTDPVFQEMKKHASTKGKGKPPDCLRGPLRSTTSEIGSYWHDPELDERDPYMDKLRAENGAKRVLPVESNSSFALEDLPTADRLL